MEFRNSKESLGVRPEMDIVTQIAKDLFQKYHQHCVVSSIKEVEDDGGKCFFSVTFKMMETVDIQDVINSQSKMKLPKGVEICVVDRNLEMKIQSSIPATSPSRHFKRINF